MKLRLLGCAFVVAIAGCTRGTAAPSTPENVGTSAGTPRAAAQIAPATIAPSNGTTPTTLGTTSPTAARPSVLEPGAVRAPDPRPRTIPPTVTARPSIPTAPVTVNVVRISASDGEDGAGNTVPATDPVAIDLVTPDGWSAGAMTRTLYVGNLHFHSGGNPSITTLRFIVARASLLPAHGEVAVQYSSDPGQRRVLAASLPVPR